MTFSAFYFICLTLNAVFWPVFFWWELRHPSGWFWNQYTIEYCPEQISWNLRDIVVALLLATVPMINVFTIIAFVIYFFMSIAPRIQVLKR